MAKKKGTRGGKDKGRGQHQKRSGLGRLHRANIKSRTRQGNWERVAEDDDWLERFGDRDRIGHFGESLLAKFNRLARDATSGEGEDAVICGFEGQFALARMPDGEERPCQVRRVLKKMLAGEKSPLCVGDEVRVQSTAEGDYVINAVAERRNQLARADSHNKSLQHVFAANIDHLVIVASLAMPEIKPGLIDRYLLIAHLGDIDPVIVLNKCDLADPTPYHELYAELDYRVINAQGDQADHEGIKELRDLLAGHTCVFAGQSGVGKSSLVNALHPELDIRIGAVSDAQLKGRHTTTSSRSYLLPDGSCLIDTPGIRECGLAGLEPMDVALLYRDMAPWQQHCRFTNCTHTHEPGCAVQAAVEEGIINPGRYASYLSIVEEDLRK